MSGAMTELERARLLSEKVLERTSADPDADMAVLARQFQRSEDRARRAIAYLEHSDAMRKVGSIRKRLIEILSGGAH